MFLISDCKRVIFSLNNRDKTKANISFWGLDLFHLNWLCRFFSLAAYGCYAEYETMQRNQMFDDAVSRNL